MAIDLAKLNVLNGFVIEGLAPGDILGVQPTYLGDVNGDGIDDFGVLAERAGPNDEGEAWIIFGRAGGFGATIDLDALGDGGLRLLGPAPGANTNRLGAAGDINADGYDDIAVGVSRDDPYTVGSATKYEGAVYVVFGGPDLAGQDLTLPVADGFKVDGTERVTSSSVWNTGEELGYSAGDRGDFNGDGVEDLIFGSNGDDTTAGDGFVLFGREDGAFPDVIDASGLDGATGVRFRGVDGFDGTGVSTTLLDLNNDGIDDFAIGARYASVAGRNSSGAVYVVFGGQDYGDGDIDLTESGGAEGLDGITLIGGPGKSVGWALDHAGDVNGDGIDDLILAGTGSNGYVSPGQPGWNPPQAHVIFGREDGFPAVIDLTADLDGTVGVTIDTIGAVSWAHSFVAGIGDFNADGFDDVLIGADDTDGFRGQATVIYGAADFGAGGRIDADRIDGTADGFLVRNSATVGEFGNGVKGAGDINDDGVADLLIGNNWSDVPGQDAGQMFGLYGIRIDVPDAVTVPLTDDYDLTEIGLTVAVSLTAPALNPITLTYETADGTAEAGSDYEAAQGALTFAVGEQTKTLTVTVLANTPEEGAETFEILLKDAVGAGFGDGPSASVSVTIPQGFLIENVNPSAADDDFVLDEDTGLSGSVFDDNGAGADDDADGDPIAVIAVDGDAQAVGTALLLASGGAVTIGADGGLTYEPAADFHGTESLTYTIADDLGATDTATVTFTVNEVPDAPEAAADRFSIAVDATLTGNVLEDNGAGADRDRDGDVLTVVDAGDPSFGIVTVDETGTFLYVPQAGFDGTDSFTYAVSDGALTGTATVTVVIGGQNTRPAAADDAFAVGFGQTIMGNVLDDNGAGADADSDGDPLSVTVLSGPDQGGLFVLETDGAFAYSPAEGFIGTETVTYTLDDGRGATDTASVTLRVGAPVVRYGLESTAASVTEGQPGASGTLTLTLTRTGSTEIAGSIGYAIAGSGGNPADADDFESPLTGMVDFAAGETERTLTIVVSGDRDREDDETFAVTLTDPQADGAMAEVTDGEAIVTILDDDAPSQLGTAGNDKLKGTQGDDTQEGLGGADKLKGRGGSDILDGGDGNDSLDGGAGNDVLLGGAGNDKLKDKTGINVFDGGAGTDQIKAGKGQDTFIFKAGNGIDEIKKFAPGIDVIDLTAFAGLTFEDFAGQAVADGKNLLFAPGGGDALILVKTSLEDLDAGDFLFA